MTSDENPPPRRFVLGDLEVAVLEALWEKQPATVKQVHARLERRGSPSHNTVQASFERLFRKGLLAREKVSHSYRYTTRGDRSSVLEEAVRDVLLRLGGSRPEPSLSAFVELAADEGEESLRMLEELVASRLGRRDDGGEAP